MPWQYPRPRRTPRRAACCTAAAGARLLLTGLVLALGLTGVVLPGFVLTAPAAQAHARLVSGTPAAGATVRTLPAGVRLEFDEDLQSRYAAVVVTGPTTGPTGGTAAAVSGRTVSAPVHDGGPGRYTVAYRVVSADGHPVAGAYSFTYRPDAYRPDAGPSTPAAPAAAAARSPQAARPGTSAAPDSGGRRTAVLLGLAGVAGAGVGALFWRRRRA